MEGSFIILRPEELDNQNNWKMATRRRSLPNFTRNMDNVENCCKVSIVDFNTSRIAPGFKTNNASDVGIKIGLDNPAYDDGNEYKSGFQTGGSAKNVISNQQAPPALSAPPPCWKRYLGISLCLLACLTLSLSKIIMKSMTQYHPFAMTLWIWISITTFNMPLLIFNQYKSKVSLFESLFPLSDPEKRKTFINVILRGVLGSTAASLQFLALKYLEIADVTVIVFCAPVFVTIAAYFLLGEKCSIFTIFAALLAIVGVAIISRPPFLTGAKEFDSDLVIGTVSAVSSMFITATVFIILRFLRKVNYAVVNLSFGGCGVIVGFILCCATSTLDYPHNALDLFLGISMGFLVYIGQLFFTCALKFETSSTVSLVRTCEVIFSFIWQLILLQVLPDIFSLVGATVVVSGVLIVGFIKWLDQLPEKNGVRRKLWFLLK